MSNGECAKFLDTDWLSAHDARYQVSLRNRSADGPASIAKRAYAGILRTAAKEFRQEQRAGTGAKETLVTQNVLLPKEFWWAKGEASLDQDWDAGDFSTWIDDTYEWQAFDVKFERIGIEAMLAPSVPASKVPTDPAADDNNDAAFFDPPLPSDEAIRAKMRELCDMGATHDVAAKLIRQVAGFEKVGNELARRVAKGFLPLGRPKKRQEK